VIVNPQSGPGETSSPDEAYQAALHQLDTYPNVQKVGYVRTGYAERNISEVLADVATYGGWQAQSSAFAMEGIFFDESPHQYAAETVEYLERINLAVKNVTGLTGERTVSLFFFLKPTLSQLSVMCSGFGNGSRRKRNDRVKIGSFGLGLAIARVNRGLLPGGARSSFARLARFCLLAHLLRSIDLIYLIYLIHSVGPAAKSQN
jgi:hypothetical protein